ncbi:MAG: hypothetical protein C0627_03220 [Sulfurimonas sp.]|nr:MAG: hypothetical protein C0627_03220 [Sulfurimonas sp.]
MASSLVDFEELIENYSYKVVLFDKEYNNLNVAKISSSIRKLSTSNGLDSHIVLIDDSVHKNATEQQEHVDEIINNVVNRELLQSLFNKYA